MGSLVLHPHFIAGLSLAGMSLDLLGGLFLAYDLLGRKRGPLRSVLRLALYSSLFGAVFQLVFGLSFGLVGGLGLGLALTIELRRADAYVAATQRDATLALGVMRGVVLGLASASILGARFGALFGALATAALLLAYRLRFAPIDEFQVSSRPRLSTHKVAGAAVRGALVGLAGFAASVPFFGTAAAMAYGLRFFLAVGVVGVIVAAASSFIEWYTDHLPDRTLGLLGIGLIGAGMLAQSVQYWVVLLDVPVR